jgi:microcystin-dependent protein
MADPFVGEIRMFAGSFAPRGWALCDGQLQSVNQNDALFSLFGTIYGGDGRTTFGLPDLRGRVPIHAGSGPGLTPRRLGQRSGVENVTLTTNQIPSHSHPLRANKQAGQQSNPNGAVPAQSTIDIYKANPMANAQKALDVDSVTSFGGSRDHTNLMPFLCVHFIVALFGISPSRD